MDKFECAVCSQFLYDAVTLPCGNSICRTCFPRFPFKPELLTQATTLDSLNTMSENNESTSHFDRPFSTCFISPHSAPTSPSNTSDVLTFACPVSRCKNLHLYRQEQQNTLMNALMEKAWPAEYHAYDTLRCLERSLFALSALDVLFASPSPQTSLPYRTTLSSSFSSPSFSSSSYFSSSISSSSSSSFSSTSQPPADNEQLTQLVKSHITALSATITHFPSLLKLRTTRASLLWYLEAYGDALTDIFTCYKLSPSSLLSCRFWLLGDAKGVKNYPVCFAVTREMNLPAPSLSSLSSTTQHQQQPQLKTQYQKPFIREFTLSDLECPVCLSPLTLPLTLPCGHTTCKQCILKCASVSPTCPICRVGLPRFEYLCGGRVNRALLETLETQFPELDAGGSNGRTSSGDREGAVERVPIFVSALAFPGLRYGFHLFEPRYRMMINRCLQTTRQFGICLPRSPSLDTLATSPTSTPSPLNSAPFQLYGTLVRITQSQQLGDPVQTTDGLLPRFMVELVGMHRFKVKEFGEDSAGYMWGDVERVDDLCVEVGCREDAERQTGEVNGVRDRDTDETEKAGEIREVSIPFFDSVGVVPEIHSLASTLIHLQRALTPLTPLSQTQLLHHTLLSTSNKSLLKHTSTLRQFTSDMLLGLHPASLLGILAKFGEPPEEIDGLVYWLAQILPVYQGERYGLLELRGVAERCGVVCGWIERAYRVLD